MLWRLAYGGSNSMWIKNAYVFTALVEVHCCIDFPISAVSNEKSDFVEP
jgi:hypothetical protein